MPKRVNNDAQTNIRLPKSMKDEIDEAATRENMSTMEWIRRACQEKLDRAAGISPPCVDRETMRGLILEVLEEEELLKKE